MSLILDSFAFESCQSLGGNSRIQPIGEKELFFLAGVNDKAVRLQIDGP